MSAFPYGNNSFPRMQESCPPEKVAGTLSNSILLGQLLYVGTEFKPVTPNIKACGNPGYIPFRAINQPMPVSNKSWPNLPAAGDSFAVPPTMVGRNGLMQVVVPDQY